VTEAQAEEAILQAWNTGWTSLHPEVPYTTENTVDNSLAEYARITVINTERQNMTIPSLRKAQFGYIAVQLFSTPGNGNLRINQLADDVRKVLENQMIYSAGVDEPVCTFTGGSDRGSSDAVWQSKLVRVRFRYDDVS
jgi:hypothetical protein